MIDWQRPCKPQEFSKRGGMRSLIGAGEHNQLARLHLYRRMGYSVERLWELDIMNADLLDRVGLPKP